MQQNRAKIEESEKTESTNKSNVPHRGLNVKTIEFDRGGLYDAPDPRDRKKTHQYKTNKIMVFNICMILIVMVPFYLMAFFINKMFNTAPPIADKELQEFDSNKVIQLTKKASSDEVIEQESINRSTTGSIDFA